MRSDPSGAFPLTSYDHTSDARRPQHCDPPLRRAQRRAVRRGRRRRALGLSHHTERTRERAVAWRMSTARSRSQLAPRVLSMRRSGGVRAVVGHLLEMGRKHTCSSVHAPHAPARPLRTLQHRMHDSARRGSTWRSCCTPAVAAQLRLQGCAVQSPSAPRARHRARVRAMHGCSTCRCAPSLGLFGRGSLSSASLSVANAALHPAAAPCAGAAARRAAAFRMEPHGVALRCLCTPQSPLVLAPHASLAAAAPRRRHTQTRAAPFTSRSGTPEVDAECACQDRAIQKPGVAPAPRKAFPERVEPAPAAPSPPLPGASVPRASAAARAPREPVHTDQPLAGVCPCPAPRHAQPRRAQGAAPRRMSPTDARRTFEEPPRTCRERARERCASANQKSRALANK